MTPDDAYLLFSRGELKFNGTSVYFDGKGHYNFVKNETPIEGTYEFISRQGKTYLRTNPPIFEGKKELEISLCLENLPVKFEKESSPFF